MVLEMATRRTSSLASSMFGGPRALQACHVGHVRHDRDASGHATSFILVSGRSLRAVSIESNTERW